MISSFLRFPVELQIYSHTSVPFLSESLRSCPFRSLFFSALLGRMLVRKLIPTLLRQRGAHSWVLGSFHSHFHSQPLTQLRRNDTHNFPISSVSFELFTPGFLRRNYATATQNDRQSGQDSETRTATGSPDGGEPSPSSSSAELLAGMKEAISKHTEEVKELKVSSISHRRRLDSLRSFWRRFQTMPRRWMATSRFFLDRDKYIRALAETENVRSRLTRQISDAKQFGIQNFVKDLLEVSDILSKAIETIPKEAFEGKNVHFESLYEGLRLTEAQLTKVFQKNGLEKTNPIGEKFDPNEHEALFEAAAEGKETGTVLTVTQPGFKLNKRVVRPARVGVVRNG